MALKLHGGKLAPRLLGDVKLYDPQYLPSSGYNVLTDLPPPFDEKAPPLRRTAKRACQHSWILKPNQTSAIMLDSPAGLGPSQVSAYCPLCRCHLKLQLDCTGQEAGLRPCPHLDAPLHHFVHLPQDSLKFRRADPPDLENWEDNREFKCSVNTCAARLSVHIRSARLRNTWVDLLANKDSISQRAKAAMAADPVRFEGHATPSASDVISTLRQYIANAMKGDSRRSIPADNKKWVLCLGDSCSELLHFLGFTRQEDAWSAPRPEPSAPAPFENELNLILDDIDKELIALLQAQTGLERHGALALPPQNPASKDFQLMLGCRDYKTKPDSRTIDLTEEEDEHPFYASLGAMRDFQDSLISFAYDQQLLADPENGPYYLECLQGISTGRQSEELQEKAAIEASLGRVSLQDIRHSFEQLGLEIGAAMTDDYIIGTFQSRVADAGDRQEGELKRALKIVGQYRNSERIEQHASDTIATHDQALSWLGATADMSEDFITSMYGVKVGENSANESLARRCVEIIADNRNSTALKTWLLTGHLTETEMDPAQAYARLNIADDKVDDNMVLSAFTGALQDAPSQLADLNRALLAIGKARKSDVLLGRAETSNGLRYSEHGLAEWPVGLENIGNTCYLNSLLQFYFSVRPLREIVLDFDNYKMTIEKGTLQKKKVGSRPVTKTEVERAQQFAYELKILFESMIKANKRQITPERQLARLTLVSSTVEDIIEDIVTRRFSTVSGTRPNLDDIREPTPKEHQTAKITGNDHMIAGEGEGEEAIVASPTQQNDPNLRNDYPSSEGTLVDATRPSTPVDNDYMVIDPVEKDEQAKAFEDKENLAPTKAEFVRPNTPDNSLQPLSEASPSRMNEQAPDTAMGGPDDKADAKLDEPSAPPSRPPPVPPRNDADTQKAMMRETEEYARQQDVTEVIGNVLFQLQCAIRAKAIDEDGEQLDEIKELFFGKLKVTTTDTSGKSRTKEEFFSDLKINVHSGPQDIYAAIDAALDKQMVTVGTTEEPQYTTISKLPPILQIYPNRTGYDRTRGAPFKVNHHLEFSDVIYMDRYLDSDDPDLKQRRDECWEWKERLRKTEARRGVLQKTPFDLDMSEALKLTADYLKAVDSVEGDGGSSPPGLALAVEQAARDAATELERLNAEATKLRELINAQFSALHSVPYRLHSVFIHRGLVTSGHYWIYIFDFATNVWRKYNDGYVTAVDDPAKEIFSTEKSDRPATPMFLVYVRDGDEKSLVEAVKREPVPEPQSQADAMQGVEMDADADTKQWNSFGRWAADGAWNGGWAGETPGSVAEAKVNGVDPNKVVNW